MSEQPATYRPSAEVDAVYQAALSATMDRCTCQGEGHDGTPCFRWIPRGAGRCVPCAEGYGAHGYNGGVGQAPSPVATTHPDSYGGPLQQAIRGRDTLRATVMALHTAVERAQQERDALREKALTELEGWSLRRDALVSEREQLRAERDALQTRLDAGAGLAGPVTAYNHLRHLIRECRAGRVPFSAVVAAAGEEA